MGRNGTSDPAGSSSTPTHIPSVGTLVMIKTCEQRKHTTLDELLPLLNTRIPFPYLL